VFGVLFGAGQSRCLHERGVRLFLSEGVLIMKIRNWSMMVLGVCLVACGDLANGGEGGAAGSSSDAGTGGGVQDAGPDAEACALGFFTHPKASGGFDWNCDGKETPDPSLNNQVDCTLCAIGMLAEGYIEAPPACGVAAPWATCAATGVTCSPQVTDPARTMACK
jgi:hypothetical protein